MNKIKSFSTLATGFRRETQTTTAGTQASANLKKSTLSKSNGACLLRK